MNQIPLVAVSFAFAIALTAGASAATVRMQASTPLASGTYQVRALDVSYDEGGLSTSEGASALYQRLQDSARTLCGELRENTSFDLGKKIAVCRKRAVADAIYKVDSPRLKAITEATP